MTENGVGAFLRGFFAPLRGFRHLATDARLRAFAFVPLAISLLVGSVATILGLYQLGRLVRFVSLQLLWLMHLDPEGFGRVIVSVVFWLLGLLILGVGVYVLVRLVAAPFYSLLAEKTLAKLGRRDDSPPSKRAWLLTSVRMFSVGLVRAILFAFAGVVLFFLSFVPVLNVVAAMGFMMMIAFDVSDYAFEAMEWPLARRFRHVRQHLMTYFGIACGLSLVMLIPGFNLIVLPAAVVGASETLHRTLGDTK